MEGRRGQVGRQLEGSEVPGRHARPISKAKSSPGGGLVGDTRGSCLTCYGLACYGWCRGRDIVGIGHGAGTQELVTLDLLW